MDKHPDASTILNSGNHILPEWRLSIEDESVFLAGRKSPGRNNSTENKFKRFILSRRFDSGFSLDLMVKDLTTAVKLARETGAPAVFSGVCRELWAAAQAVLEAESDHTDVVRWFEKMAKTELRQPHHSFET